MKANRRWWLVIAVTGLLVTAACDGGASSAAPPTTSAARAEPVYVDGVPQVVATPSRAPAGTRVQLDGYGFVGDPWQAGPEYLALTDLSQYGECVVFARADHDLTVTTDGHLSGHFVVPAEGECRYAPGRINFAGASHRYVIEYGCPTCRIGTFTVILPGESMEEPTGTACVVTVSFGVQNFADQVYADGLSCEEAESFLHDHAGSLRPVTGPAHLDAGGFSCDRTGQSDAALPPRANYRCTRGSESIWFNRQ
jgi:hypothetical protein